MTKFKFEPDPQADERKRSAFALIKCLLAATDVIPEHRRDLLSIALWKLTEAEGGSKYNARCPSRHALGCTDKAKLRHDHVFQRAKMIADLEKASEEATPDRIDDILERAVGCVVTVEEHKRLTRFDKEYDVGAVSESGNFRYRYSNR